MVLVVVFEGQKVTGGKTVIIILSRYVLLSERMQRNSGILQCADCAGRLGTKDKCYIGLVGRPSISDSTSDRLQCSRAFSDAPQYSIHDIGMPVVRKPAGFSWQQA